MADNIIIENVGGLRGVASEATLLNLVDAIRRSNANDPASANSAAKKAQDLYTKSIRESTTSQNEYTTALGDATDKLYNFGKELLVGGDRLSDFANNLFGGGSVLTRFVGYVDGVIDNFRSLSSVGATFGNSMFEMITVSADAAMTLDSFVQMIRTNSDALARFGGTVSNGARFMADFSKDVRLGIGRDFFAMGMTIEDINEGLIGYLDLETMRGRRNLRNDANLQASAANYITQLDLLARLTGKQKSALIQTQAALQTDAKLRNNINRVAARLGDEAANQLRNIYTFQRETLPGFNDALLDLSDGVAQSDIGRALESVAPGITRFSMAVANGEISQEEYVRRMQTEFGPRLQQFAGTLDGATLDVYRSRGGFYGALAQLADGAYEFSNLMNIDVRAARRDQQRRDRITATLGRFEQGIIALRTFLFDKFINSAFARKLGEFGEYLINLFDDNSPTGLGAANSMFQGFFDKLFGENGYLTRALDWLADFVKDGRLGTALDAMANAVSAVVDWFAQFVENIATEGFFEAIAIEFRRLMNFLFGERGANDQGEGGRGERVGGFVDSVLQSITNAFSEIFNSDDPDNPFNRIWSYFETKFEEWSETLFAEGENPGVLTRLWAWVEEKWNGFVERLFSTDPTSLWERFKTSLNNYIFGNEETGEESLWQRFRDMVGIPETFTLSSLWDTLRTMVFGEDDENNRTSIIDRIVNFLEEGLGKIFTGNAFKFMMTDLGYTIESAISSALGQAGGLISGDSAENARAVRERQSRGRELYQTLQGLDPNSQAYADTARQLREMGYSFAQGTNGFKNFGTQGSLAVLHNTEAVVPRNSPAGEILDAFYKSQENRVTSTPVSKPTFNQSDLGNKIDQLNNTMQQVVVLLSDSVGVQRRTMRNIHGMGTDLLRG